MSFPYPKKTAWFVPLKCNYLFFVYLLGQPSKLFMTKDIDWAPSKRLGHEKFKVTDVEGILQRNNKSAERMKKRLLNYKDVNVQSEKKKPACSLHRQLDETSEQNRFPVMEEAPEDVQRKDAPCQIELSSIDIANMEDDLKRSTEEINKLKREVLSASLTQESFENNDEKVLFYTGLPNFITLMAIFDLLEPFITITACSSLDKFQQVLLFLMRIRLNLTCEDLGYRFVLSRSTVSRTFLNILDIAASRLAFLIKWPEREELWKTTPMSFKKNFKTRVAIVIDCFVVFIEKPANLLVRSQTFSTYKHHNTAKFLIGICPQGVISFISKAWGGRVSDKHLTEHCGILNYLLPKDIILADRGFGIQDSAALYYAEVNIPAFTRGKKQLHSLQVKETRKIASAQIHVERVIGLVRRKYTILQSTLPTDYLGNKDSDGMTVLDKIALVACTLTNVCDSVVPFD